MVMHLPMPRSHMAVSQAEVSGWVFARDEPDDFGDQLGGDNHHGVALNIHDPCVLGNLLGF